MKIGSMSRYMKSLNNADLEKLLPVEKEKNDPINIAAQVEFERRIRRRARRTKENP